MDPPTTPALLIEVTCAFAVGSDVGSSSGPPDAQEIPSA
jgi:hypothetical protein